MVYEWFTLDGEALSSSSGNVVTVEEVLEILEVEVLRYFFTKNPSKQRDFDVGRIDRLVDEFDRLERLYYGEVVRFPGEDEDSPGDADLEASREGLPPAQRIYPMVVDEVPGEQPLRIPFRFAAVLGMTDNRDLQVRMARRSGHLPEEAGEAAVDAALARIEKAHAWAVRTDNEFNYRLAEDLPEVEFDPAVEAALDDLADFVEAESPDEEALQGEIYETAKAADVDVGDLFGAGYRLFLDEDEGPRLGPFLAAMDREFVVRRLRREA
jgi:lysyl-tRNA synthetase class 1